MALETATYLDSLITSNPAGSDNASTADDHIRLIKACLQRTFPLIAGKVSASHSAIMHAVRGELSVTYASTAGFASSASEATSLKTVLYTVYDDNSLVGETGLTTSPSTTLTLEPNAHYRLEGEIHYINRGGGFRFSPQATNIEIATGRRMVHYTGATEDQSLQDLTDTFLRTGKFGFAQRPSLSGNVCIRFMGTVFTSATGSYYMRVESPQSAAAGQTVLLKGSWIRAEKIG